MPSTNASRLSNQATQHVFQKFPAVASPTEQPFSPAWAELLAAAPNNYLQDVEIFGEGEPADYLYKVIDGAVRTFKILSDGRRQITKFSVAGDFFGIEPDDKHSFSAETITNSRIITIKRSALAVLAERGPEVSHQLHGMLACELHQARSHAALLILNAHERVARFLLEMAREPGATEIDIPMSRQDIADYVGLTLETVSRVFSDFEANDAIARPTPRRLVLCNRAKLSLIS